MDLETNWEIKQTSNALQNALLGITSDIGNETFFSEGDLGEYMYEGPWAEEGMRKYFHKFSQSGIYLKYHEPLFPLPG